MHYDNQQGLFEKLHSKMYLPLEPTSVTSDAMTEIELGFPAEISAERGGLPSLIAVPDESQCHDDKTTCDEVVGHGQHCHDYNGQQISVCDWNEIKYAPSPPKSCGLDCETISESVIEYLLERVRHVLVKVKARVLPICQTATASAGPTVMVTNTYVDTYGVYDRVRYSGTQIHVARLQWDALSAGSCKWCAGLLYEPNWCHCCARKIAQQSLRQCCNDISKDYAPEPLAAVPLYFYTPSPPTDNLVNRTRSRLVFATSDLLSLGHLAKLVITAKKQRTAVFLQQLKIVRVRPYFNLVDQRLGRASVMSGLTSSAVVPLTTRRPSEKREERTENVEQRKVQIDKRNSLYLQKNAVQGKEAQWALRRSFVVKVSLLEPLDTEDFVFLMSTDPGLVDLDQIAVHREPLDLLVLRQLAMLTKLGLIMMRPKHQRVKEELTSNTRNINHNSILITMRMYQLEGQSATDLESYPVRLVEVKCDKAQLSRSPAGPSSGTRFIVMMASTLLENRQAEKVHDDLCRRDKQLCRNFREMDLHCVQAMILSLDESKTHLQRQFSGKMLWDQYCLILYICFVPEYLVGRKEGGCTSKTSKTRKTAVTSTPKLGTIANFTREWSENAHNLIIPSPDAAGMLKHKAAGQLHDTLDAKGIFGQIYPDPGHWRHHRRHAILTTLENDTSVVNHAIQRHLTRQFYPDVDRFILFMDIDLDDIVIHSDNLKDDANHVKINMNILQKPGPYLSHTRDKVYFAPALRLLRRMINNQGVRMDPDEVDRVVLWRAPGNCDLSRDVISSASYLEDEMTYVHIPMGLLNLLVQPRPESTPFNSEWNNRILDVRQPAFDEVRDRVCCMMEYCRVLSKYFKNVAAPAQTSTDDVSKVIIRETESKRAKMSAHLEANLNTAKQSYSMHEFETLTGIGTILKCVVMLNELRTQNLWLMDHNCLIHSLNKKISFNLQSCWLEELGLRPANFCVTYMEKSKNQVTDKLSRLHPSYSPERAGIEVATCNVEMSTVLKLQVMTAIEAQTARWLDATTKDQSYKTVYTCFVPKCLEGRKEGGSTSKTNKDHHTSKTNDGCNVMVTVTCVTHHSLPLTVTATWSSVVYSDTVPTGAIIITSLASVAHSKSDASSKRASCTGITTKTWYQCLHRPANQPETDWMSRIMISLIRVSVSSTAIVLEYPLALASVCEFALQKKSALRGLACLLITSVSFPKPKGLTRKPTYLLIPKAIVSHKPLRDSEITSIQLDLHSRSKSHQLRDSESDIIFHSSVPHTPMSSDNILLSGRTETQVNNTNDFEEVRKLTERPISISSLIISETDAVFEVKWIFDL
jgi:hypothetical protein